MLENIKLLLNITDTSKDALITLLIERCQDEFVNYTNNDDYCSADSLISAMVVYQYNRLGTEGAASENYSGVSFNYTNEYPETIMRQLKTKRKLRVW